MTNKQETARAWDDNRERYMAYMHGWSDGAAVRAIRPFDCDADAAVVAAYHEGYANGQNDRRKRSLAAAERYHHDPSVRLTATDAL